MSAATRKAEKRIQRICQKFFEDLQAFLDSDEMTDDAADGEVYEAAVNAQAAAEDATNAELSR